MRKIPSLFMRDYDNNGLVYNVVTPGTEWVINGEGLPTVKFDGSACWVYVDKLFRRYDRKLTKVSYAKKKQNPLFIANIEDYKETPPGWIACVKYPDPITHHWPGWFPVGDGPEDQWHREAFRSNLENGTYELVGPKIQNNPYDLIQHDLWKHGSTLMLDFPRDFETVEAFLKKEAIEGIVWHHEDGRMAKIKRSDFGIKWPL